ncbi:MAG: DUF2442 domain-containing protein [Ginsengibacter sp.]
MKKVIVVKPLENYILQLEFDSNEIRFFDVKPYLNKGIFSDLKDENYFRNVRTNFGSIAWKNGQDFSPETLYLKSISLVTKSFLN